MILKGDHPTTIPVIFGFKYDSVVSDEYFNMFLFGQHQPKLHIFIKMIKVENVVTTPVSNMILLISPGDKRLYLLCMSAVFY